MISRNHFIRQIARVGAVATLAGIAGLLGYRQQLKKTKEECGDTFCDRCGELDTCSLSKALNYKKTT